MLDPDNPMIADALLLQGRVYQKQGRLRSAQRSVSEAVAIYHEAYGRPHFLIGIAEVYLALIQSDRGHFVEALATMDAAKHNYDVGYGKLHANHGDLLVNRATVLAKAGRKAEARAACAQGLKILGQTLGPNASYTRAMAAVCDRI